MHPVLRAHLAHAQTQVAADVFDHWATGTAGEVTAAEAEHAWAAIRLRPRVLRDVSTVDTSLTLLGADLRTPVVVAPTALHALAHPDAERGTGRGARAAGALTVVSTRASGDPTSTGADPWWLQVYVQRDRSRTAELVQRAAAQGAGALVLTGDTPYVGVKARGDFPAQVDVEDATRQDAATTLADIGWLADTSGLPILVKGVLRADDALACLEAGAAGIVVSNHGGRQLDRTLCTARALPDVVEAVAGRAPVLVDGGVRSGLDVLCALALGATAVCVGRPILWALAADGAGGVAACLAALTDDLGHVMALAGAGALAEVTPDLIA